MELSKHLKNYLSLSGNKSGFLMTGGECRYLFGNRSCPAKCEMLRLKSESADLLTEYYNNLLAVLRDGEPSVYLGGKRLLRMRELFLMYSVKTDSGKLFGVITGGALPCGDIRFSEERICELFKAVFAQKSEQSKCYSEELSELKKLLDSKETKELNGLYLSGKPITEE